MNNFNLTDHQKILFISAMCGITIQTSCLYFFFVIVNKKKFNYTYWIAYLFFSALAYMCYYKLILP